MRIINGQVFFNCDVFKQKSYLKWVLCTCFIFVDLTVQEWEVKSVYFEI